MELIFGIILIFLLLVWIGGAIQTFKRTIIGALLALIFVPPIWFLWAIVELFLENPSKKNTESKIPQEK